MRLVLAAVIAVLLGGAFYRLGRWLGPARPTDLIEGDELRQYRERQAERRAQRREAPERRKVWWT